MHSQKNIKLCLAEFSPNFSPRRNPETIFHIPRNPFPYNDKGSETTDNGESSVITAKLLSITFICQELLRI